MLVKHKKDMIKFYENDQIAKEYVGKRYQNPIGKTLHEKQVNCVNQFISKGNFDSVLEIACGPGRLTKDVKPVKNSLALDSSNAMLKIAKKNAPAWNFQNSDAFNLKLQSKYDLVYSFKLIRHFDEEKRTKLYEQFHKVLNPNGYFIFDMPDKKMGSFVWKFTRKEDEYVFDVALSKKKIKKELSPYFKVIKFIPVVNLFPLQYAVSKLGEKRFKKTAENIVNFTEGINLGVPWEWIVVCKKI